MLKFIISSVFIIRCLLFFICIVLYILRMIIQYFVFWLIYLYIPIFPFFFFFLSAFLNCIVWDIYTFVYLLIIWFAICNFYIFRNCCIAFLFYLVYWSLCVQCIVKMYMYWFFWVFKCIKFINGLYDGIGFNFPIFSLVCFLFGINLSILSASIIMIFGLCRLYLLIVYFWFGINVSY